MGVKKCFNVLEYNINSHTKKEYDVLPYFRDSWKNKRFSKEKENVKDKKTLKEWIKSCSQYNFWSRCEYEFLMAPWPMGRYKTNQELKELLATGFDVTNYEQNIKFYNIIMRDMYKIDVHEQIMMNIDIITDILFDEFAIEKKKSTKKVD